MSARRKRLRAARAIDLPRAKAALAKLDELVAAQPQLISLQNQERLAKHLDLDHEAREKGDEDGSEEDSDG